MNNNQSKLTQEIIVSGESAVIEKIVRVNREIQLNQNGIAKFIQHGKHHGCVKTQT